MVTKIEVYGRVQGVNFRNYVKDFCDARDLNGKVANRNDGSVLIVVEGLEGDVKALINFVKKSPGLSRVDKIVKRKMVFKKKLEGFQIVKSGNLIEDQKIALGNLGKSLLKT